MKADVRARERLNTTYRRFMSEADPKRKREAGKDLISAIFGREALAERSGSLDFHEPFGNIFWLA